MTSPDTAPTSLPAFTPVPRKRPRHDGWTPERQKDFISALATCGSVVEAARHVGMGFTTAYGLRTSPGAEEFVAAWDAALEHATARIHDVLIDHAINGTPVPIIYQGEVTDEYRAFNHRLMMWLLSHHKPEKFSAHGSAKRGPSAGELKDLKAEWRAEWEAEQAEEQRERGDVYFDKLNTRLEDMRTRMIARQEAGQTFNPKGASKAEIMVQGWIEEDEDGEDHDVK